MCHRFVNFETLDSKQDQFIVESSVNDYLRVLGQSEGIAAIAYSKVHNEIRDLNIATSYERERVWTICVVFNPKKSLRVEQILKQ